MAGRDVEDVVSTFAAPRAHPGLCFRNMIITQLLGLVQGRRGVYFCSNWATAGNGHDLSLVAGMCVADAIGAEYPFPDEAESRADLVMLRYFMGL